MKFQLPAGHIPAANASTPDTILSGLLPAPTSGRRVIPANTKLIDDPALWDEDGVLRPVPTAFWESCTSDERGKFGAKHSIYGFITTEMVDRLREMIAGREAETLEIGAGNGGLCRALGIRGIDSKYQQDSRTQMTLLSMGNHAVNYGEHVETIQATDAMRKYKPKVVIASWVTHKYDPRRPHFEGNMYGVDEHYVLNRCDEYIFIGANMAVHRGKLLFQDLASGKVKSHELVCFETGPHIQSRSEGEGFMVHLRRKSQ